MNVVDAMPEIDARGQKLNLNSHELDDKSVCISVTDAGCGLAPAVAAHIFEPFVTSKPAGLGLRLSICHSIIEAHSGTLEVFPL